MMIGPRVMRSSDIFARQPCAYLYGEGLALFIRTGGAAVRVLISREPRTRSEAQGIQKPDSLQTGTLPKQALRLEC
jgi:hypothetical protein